MSLYRTDFRAMGSPCALQLHAATQREADAGFAFCRDEVERLERKYTRFRDDSTTSAINATSGSPGGIDVDEETAGLLDYAATAHAQSDGLFDLTSGILRRAWDFKSGRLPTREAVAALVARVGWQHVQWTRPRFVLPFEGMEIDFGGVVKEYAADRVAELCRTRGVHHGLVDLGGDLAVIGPHPGGRPWIVGVRDPRGGTRAATRVAVYGGGVATSGDYERGMTVDGVRYGHLLDPRSGWPVRGPASVTVLASHCLIAGTASTVAALSGSAGARPWLARVGLPHVGIEHDGKRFERWPSGPASAGVATRQAP